MHERSWSSESGGTGEVTMHQYEERNGPMQYPRIGQGHVQQNAAVPGLKGCMVCHVLSPVNACQDAVYRCISPTRTHRTLETIGGTRTRYNDCKIVRVVSKTSLASLINTATDEL